MEKGCPGFQWLPLLWGCGLEGQTTMHNLQQTAVLRAPPVQGSPQPKIQPPRMTFFGLLTPSAPECLGRVPHQIRPCAGGWSNSRAGETPINEPRRLPRRELRGERQPAPGLVVRGGAEEAEEAGLRRAGGQGCPPAGGGAAGPPGAADAVSSEPK